MYDINPCLTAKEIKDIIKNTGDPIDDAGHFPGQLGGGRINAYEAVKLAGSTFVQNEIINSNQIISSGHGVFVGSNVTPNQSSGLVLLKKGHNLTLQSRNIVVLENGFTMEPNSNLTIEINPNLTLTCN